MATVCNYCSKEITDDFLNCLQCNKDVHISCLKVPEDGILLGDIFYDLRCAKCRSPEKEEIKRRKLRW